MFRPTGPRQRSGTLLRGILVASALLTTVAVTASADPSYIYGIHDPGGEHLMSSAKGWIVWTEAIGISGSGGNNYSNWSNQGYGVIVRLNNGYGGSGNLPYEYQYPQFASRCANYISNSQGVDYWIIGNETNLPREWPGNVNGDPATGEPITSARYISCYNQCYTAIKAVAPSAKLCPSPSGTWAPPYAAQGIEGFDDYWVNCLNGIGASKIDGLAIHSYTHGCDPGLITSEQKMGPPYEDIYYQFRAYKNYMWIIPSTMTDKPVLLTECDQNVECADNSTPRKTWYNVNNGWMKAAYAEINSWNQNNDQQIRCVVMFRWPLAQEGEWTFGLEDRYECQADFQEAVAFGYTWDGGGGPPPGELDGTNIAPASTQVDTSANYSGSYTGDNAIDGVVHVDSRWVSDGSAMPEWLKLDLGGDKTVYGVKVRHASDAGEPTHYNTEAFQIQTATSYNGTYSTVATVNNSAQDGVSVVEFSSSVDTQYIQLYITDAGSDNYVRLPEFEVWGEDSGGPPPTVETTNDPPTGTNVATSSSQVATDSEFSGSHSGGKAIDGVISDGSKWVTDGGSSIAWITLDLGATKTITGYKIHHASAGGEPSYYNTQLFDMQVGTSFTGPWTTHAAVDNSAQAGVTNLSYVTPQDIRYIRMYITDPGADNYVRLPELEVYEDASVPPVIGLSVSTLAASCDEGSDASSASFTVQNDGGDTLSYSVSDNVSWLSCSPTSGTSTGEADTITVTYDTDSLADGSYSATITVSDPNATNNSQTIAVSLTVNEVSQGMTDSVPTGNNVAGSSTQIATDSDFNSSLTGANAVDGEITLNGRWVSTATSSTHWLTLDLGSDQDLTGYIVRHASEAGEATMYNLQAFQIQSGTSFTGPWTDEAVVDNSGQAGVTNRSYASPKTLRYIRLYITDAGTDNYVRLPEFEVYADSGGGGGPTTVSEDFGSMPSWSSSFDASWGSSASWSIVGGGQSGNALQASRGSQGSSAKVKVYTIDASTNYTISVYIKCPSSSNTYWAECAYKLGSNTANNFDDSGATWTMIKKFDNGGANGNGNTWTQYSLNFNSGSDTQISVGHKLGSSGGGGPTVLWDTLRVE